MVEDCSSRTGANSKQIAGKFGDKVALDINTMTEDERAALDKQLAAATDAKDIHKGRDGYHEKAPPMTEKAEV